MNPITSTPVKGNKKINNPLSQYVPDCLSFEIAMERYCKMHWNSSSSSRRSSSEPIGSLVDSGRSSLTSYGSEESLSSDELEVFSDGYSDFEDDDECNSNIADISLKQFDHLWEEWKIPVKDITIHRTQQMVQSKSRLTTTTTTSGYWHGAVMVYQRSINDIEATKEFVSGIKTLCKIRHENIQLFMGVCIDMPENDVAIVMSELKGETLHNHLQKYGLKFACLNKLKILRQIAEGMEYLHAKGIPHGTLSSDMITYHHRVCISMSLSTTRTRALNAADITYLSAEEVRKISVNNNQVLVLPTQPSFTSDIFAYGTIAYELMTLERPYTNLSLVDLIWTLGNGVYQSLDLLPKGRFRSIISKCWSTIPTKRPKFNKILSQVQDDSQQLLGKYSSVNFHNYSVPSHLFSLGGIH